MRTPEKSLPFALLACVTSEERAAAIEGDLIEQRASRGQAWFALHVARTALALFAHAVTREPRRIALLSAAAVAASCLVCPLVDRVFSGPDARIPVPAFGSAAIVASAVLIGAVLGRAGGASGVRAAATTTLLLALLFTFSQALQGFGGNGALDALGSFAAKFAVAMIMFPGPLLIASVYAHVRRL
jgi:hypothetical protein